MESDTEAAAPPTSVYVDDSDGNTFDAASALNENVYIPDSDEEGMQVAASLYIPESDEGNMDAGLSDVYISGTDEEVDGAPLPDDIYIPLSDEDEVDGPSEIYVPSSDGDDIYVPSSGEEDDGPAGRVVYEGRTGRPIGSHSALSFADFEDRWLE